MRDYSNYIVYVPAVQYGFAAGVKNVSTGVETISVFPNPATTTTQLSFPADFAPSTVTLTVRTMTGSVVLSKSNQMLDSNRRLTLDVSMLIPGNYLIVGQAAGKTFTSKLLKQ